LVIYSQIPFGFAGGMQLFTPVQNGTNLSKKELEKLEIEQNKKIVQLEHEYKQEKNENKIKCYTT